MVIIGYEKEKAEIKELKEMLCNFENYKANGVRIPRGLLLYGEAGVGKTMLARSIAGEGINLIELSAALCCDEDVADIISEAFAKAKNSAPSVLLIDELDKIAGANERFHTNNNDKSRKVLLTALDELSDSDRVLVVGTCNDIETMEDALIRPGRFDRILKIDLPDEETRKSILEEYLNRIKVKINFDVTALAHNTRGFSGAKLECLVNETGIIALQKGKHIIKEEDVRYVLNKMEFGALEKNPFQDYDILHHVAVHEAGHALVAMLLCPENLFGASVMPQGESNGHIRFVPDSSMQSVSEIENEIAIILGGHIAERYVFNEYNIGARSDIRKATIRLHYLATKEAAYGYKYVLDGVCGESLSESTKLQLENLINKKLEEIDKRTEQLICSNATLYYKIVKALEEKLVLSFEELKELADSELCERVA